MQKFRKYIPTILFFISILTLNIFIVEFRGLSTVDFTWTFGAAHDMSKGLIPYAEFNTIIFPLFSALMAPFARNIEMYHIAGSIIFALLSTLVFVNLKKFRWIFCCLCAIKLFGIPFIEYNTVMIFFLIFSIFCINKYFETEKLKYIFYSGLLLCLALLTKHNAPAIVIVFFTIYLFVKCIKAKKYKDFVLYAIGGLLPAIILVCISLYFDFFQEMIDFTILGVLGFQKLRAWHFSATAIYSLIIAIVIYAFVFRKQLYYLGYIIAGLMIISMNDLFHNTCGLMYYGIIFLVLLQNYEFSISGFVLDIKERTLKIKNILYILFIFCLIFISILFGICTVSNCINIINVSDYRFENSRIYGDIKVSDYFYNIVTDISEYIEAHPDDNICVVSEFARAVSLYKDVDWGVMNMTLIHNGGTKGTEKVIEKMYEFDRLIVLKTESVFADKSIYEYIESHFDVCDTIMINDKAYNVYITN